MIAGLNPLVECKDSGHRWLGQVPEHCSNKRGKFCLITGDERTKIGKKDLRTLSSAREGALNSLPSMILTILSPQSC